MYNLPALKNHKHQLKQAGLLSLYQWQHVYPPYPTHTETEGYQDINYYYLLGDKPVSYSNINAWHYTASCRLLDHHFR